MNHRSKVSPVRLLGTVVVLLAMMIALQRYQPAATGDGIYNAQNLTATGFIILTAFSMGEFFRLMRIPALLGYIFAGIFFGPNFATLLPGEPQALFGTGVIENLALINILTVGVIGTMGGGELKLADLRLNFKTILMVVLINLAVVVPVCALLVYDLAAYAPAIVPFAKDLSPAELLALALMFGVFGAAMSPTVTLAVMQEARARGSFTSLVLGVVVLADLVLVALFLVALSISKLIVSPEGVTSAAVVSALPAIAREFGNALLVGVATGLVTILYLRFVAKERLLFTVAVIFATSYACKLLHAETLLAFLTAGFVVQNLSKRGSEMIVALERISLPVFVIYFMTQAAQLDLRAVVATIGLVLILTAARAGALFVASRAGAHITRAPDSTRRYLWLGLLSRGSVDLVLAALLADAMPGWGTNLQTVTMGIVVIHIILGPPLLKAALDWVGESEDARRSARADAETQDPWLSTDLEGAPQPAFPLTGFDSKPLDARITIIREHLGELHQRLLVDPIESRANRMREAIERLDEGMQQAAKRLHTLLETDDTSPEARSKAAAEIRVELERATEPAVRLLEAASPTAVGEAAVDHLLQNIRGFEPFGSLFRIPGEAHLYEARPDDGGFSTAVKFLRRVRRFVRGHAIRSLPLGRLWRFYVELAVPMALARAADACSEKNEEIWRLLVAYARGIDDLFDATELSVLTERKAELERIMATAKNKAETATDIALHRYGRSLVGPFSDFIAAAERAGTLELPAFSYRPSARFDRARRAEGRLRARLRRELELASSLQGWLISRHHTALFVDWFTRYGARLVEVLASRVLQPGRRELESVRESCETLLRMETAGADQTADWAAALNEEIKPTLRRATRHIQRIQYEFTYGTAGRELQEVLTARIGTLPKKVNLPAENPIKSAGERTASVPIALRDWFMAGLAREVGLRLVEVRERVHASLRDSEETLEDIDQILDFNLSVVQREGDASGEEEKREMAKSALERAIRLLSDRTEAQHVQIEEIGDWFMTEAAVIMERTVQPLREHRLDDIRRAAARRAAAALKGRGGTWASRQLDRVARQVKRLRSRWWPSITRAGEDLRRLLVQDRATLARSEIRTRLRPELRSPPNLPHAYARIFAPTPVEISEFFVSRPHLESTLAATIEAWIRGSARSVMVHGDRGAGKRSLVQHVLANISPGKDVPISTLIMDEQSTSEAALSRQLGRELSKYPPATFDSLERLIKARDGRMIMVIQNGEKLFSRTDEGIDLCRRFLNLVAATSEEVLWIVLMNASSARWLDTALGLFDFFTDAIEIDPLEAAEIEEMILRRHRVSGLGAVYGTSRPGTSDSPTGPLTASRAMRRAQDHFFERLHAVSRGNPLLALLYWLEAASPDSEDDELVRLQPIEREPDVVESLSLEKKLVLAALVQHQTLSLSMLSAVVRDDSGRTKTELEHLERLGFVEETGPATGTYRLKAFPELLATHALRRMNLV